MLRLVSGVYLFWKDRRLSFEFVSGIQKRWEMLHENVSEINNEELATFSWAGSFLGESEIDFRTGEFVAERWWEGFWEGVRKFLG